MDMNNKTDQNDEIDIVEITRKVRERARNNKLSEQKLNIQSNISGLCSELSSVIQSEERNVNEPDPQNNPIESDNDFKSQYIDETLRSSGVFKDQYSIEDLLKDPGFSRFNTRLNRRFSNYISKQLQYNEDIARCFSQFVCDTGRFNHHTIQKFEQWEQYKNQWEQYKENLELIISGFEARESELYQKVILLTDKLAKFEARESGLSYGINQLTEVTPEKLKAKSKKKIAYFSPISPQISGIAQYSKELLLELAKHIDIDLFLNLNIEPDDIDIINNIKYFPYTAFTQMQKTEQYDAVIYHIGNNTLHEYIYDFALKYPGIIVLHDYIIHPFIWTITLNKGRKDLYLSHLLSIETPTRMHIIKHILDEGIDNINMIDYPLCEHLVKKSKRIIVQSDYILDKLKIYPNVTKIPLGRYSVEYSYEQVQNNLNQLELSIDEIIISIFGFMNWNKRIDLIIRVFNKLKIELKNIRLLLVGSITSDFLTLINENPERINIIGYVAEDDYHKYLSVSDIIINLRYPTMGETSGTLLDAMAFGKPVIVSNIGSYSEVSDNCCWKIDVDENEEEVLFLSLRELISNSHLREIIGKNGREFVKKNHNWEDIAQQYIKLISDC